jgi:hypothetical protein
MSSATGFSVNCGLAGRIENFLMVSLVGYYQGCGINDLAVGDLKTRVNLFVDTCHSPILSAYKGKRRELFLVRYSVVMRWSLHE